MTLALQQHGVSRLLGNAKNGVCSALDLSGTVGRGISLLPPLMVVIGCGGKFHGWIGRGLSIRGVGR